MNKEIQKTQSKLQDCKLERERKKAKYDSQTVILEGQRNMLHNLEELNQVCMREFMDADRAVQEVNEQLKAAIDAEETKEAES